MRIFTFQIGVFYFLKQVFSERFHFSNLLFFTDCFFIFWFRFYLRIQFSEGEVKIEIEIEVEAKVKVKFEVGMFLNKRSRLIFHEAASVDDLFF